MRGFRDGLDGVTRFTGVLNWTPPPWLLRLHETPPSWWTRLRERTKDLRDVARRVLLHPGEVPRRALLVGASASVLPFAFWGAARWAASRPHPAIFRVELTAPGATPMTDDAVPHALVLRVLGSAARLGDVGKPVRAGITLTPPFPGEWRWTSDSELRFTPRLDWPVGRDFRVRLERSLFPEHVRLESYAYEFRTAPFTARVKDSQFYQDPRDPMVKRAVWTLSFSHPVDTKDLEGRVTLRLPGEATGWFFSEERQLSFTATYDKRKSEAYLQSAVLGIPDKDSSVVLEVAPGLRSARGGPAFEGKLESPVSVPGMFTYFHVEGVDIALPRNERYEPEQAVIVSLSAGAKEEVVRSHLHAWLLPRDRPAHDGRPAATSYSWNDASIIGPEILALSTAVKLEALPVDKDFALQHGFRVHVPPGRFLLVQLDKGAQSLGGYVLAHTFVKTLEVPAFPRELQIMADGALLSLGGERKLSVVSRGIDAIRFQIGRVVPGNINHLVSQSGGRFKDPQFENWRFGPDNITERFKETVDLKNPAPEKTQYSALELDHYLEKAGEARKQGLFLVKLQAWDPIRKEASPPEDSRLILVTDLGLVVKDDRYGGHDVFVMSIGAGTPAAGARVEVLGLNGVAIAAQTTDEQGRVSFPSFEGFEREKKPVAYVAKLGQDLSFIPYEWGDRRLDLARFDVGGVRPEAGEGGLTAYGFSDRGIYRPGDELRAAFIVKGSDWAQDFGGVPLEVALTDPRGLEVLKKKVSLPASGLLELKHATDETSPTGRWQWSVYVVKDQGRANLLGSSGVRVEEFLPDRMKIDTRLSAERARGWVSPKGLSGRVSLKNLFGVPAAGRRVSAELSLEPSPPVFAGLEDYQFLDPQHAKRSYSERLQDGKTDEKGEAEFELDLARWERATYRVVFSAEGHESESGRAVSAESAVLVSDLAHLVGYKADGDLLHVHKGSTRTVELIAVDPALARSALGGLTALIVEQRYVSVLERQANGTYSYRSVLRETPVSAKPLTLPKTGLRYRLPTTRAGDFALVVRDAQATELARARFSVVGSANLTRSLEKNAELQIRLDKGDYAPGETIEVQLRAPYGGAGLITIERDRVYAAKWFKSATTASVQRIRIPEGLEGNAYVHVAFVRSLDSPEIFASPLSYGIAPFSLSRARRTNELTLDTPALARPGEPFTIRYKSAKPGRIVLFAVDEGILQVAAYKTPDPLGHFFAKRALEVQTSQILDLILPEFRQLQALSATGGDQGAKALGHNLNPFRRRRDKPVAFWSGVLETGPEGREVTYAVPDHFNGTLRVMAVAVSREAIGVAEKRSLVRAVYTISPNVPTFAAPGDEFTVSVAVANNDEGSGKDASVSLRLDASKHVDLLDGAGRTLAAGEGREATATYRLRVKEAPGSAHLAFTASRGERSSKASVDFSVRPAVPYRVTVAGGSFRDGKAEVATPRRLYPEYRELSATASPVPLVLAHGLTQYLKKYPYGCSEQVVSQTWPALVLKAHPGFGYTPGAADTAFADALRTLRGRQNAEGAFGFWAANSFVSPFHTAYGLHFLTDAAALGYAVPNEVFSRGMVFLRGLAQADGGDLSDERLRAYAAYVLSRHGIMASQYAASIQARLESRKDDAWKHDLVAGYLAAVYQLHQDERKARKLLDGLELGDQTADDYDHYYDPLARDAQLLYLFARHFPDRLAAVKSRQLERMAERIARQKFNTVSAAYTILAFGALAEAAGPKALEGLKVEERLAGGGSRPINLPKGLFEKAGFSTDASAVRFAGDGLVFYQATQAGFDRQAPTTELAQGLEVHREYVDAAGNVLTRVPLGEEIQVRVRVRAPGRPRPNVAIVDLLPGGFEPVIESLPRWGVEAPAPGGCDEEGGCDGGPATPVAQVGGGGWSADYVDVREDRVVIFGSVAPQLQELTYKVRATNRGRFAVPPAYAESMYDRGVQAQGVGAPIEVR